MLYCRPTETILQELGALYSKTGPKFNLDTNLSHYNKYDYGDITYFTVYMEEVVIVSIRGTEFERVYDWMVDLDTWMESFVYQVSASSYCRSYSIVFTGDIDVISMVEIFS
jgi:hypothetical protein